MAEVVVFGSVNLDLVATVTALPAPGETVLASGFAQHGGGKGANQAVAAARLGASVAFVGAVGSDEPGRALRSALAAERVDTAGLRQDAAPTGTAIILVDGRGENVIVVASGANMTLDAADADRAAALLRPGAVLLCQLEVPVRAVVAAAAAARGAGATVILNAAPAGAVSAELLRHVDVLVVNEGEAGAILGRPVGSAEEGSAAAADLATRVPAVVVTLGARGAVLAAGDRPMPVPAIPVPAVDTVGAGDAFVGALACELARGGALRDAVRVGTAAGALAACRPGAQDALPTRAEVDHLLANAAMPPVEEGVPGVA